MRPTPPLIPELVAAAAILCSAHHTDHNRRTYGIEGDAVACIYLLAEDHNMDNKTGFTLDETLPIVAAAITRAYAHHHQFVSVKQVGPLLLEDGAGRGQIKRALKRMDGKHTPESIASNMIAFFGQRWTMNENDPKYSDLFKKFDRKREGQRWFYKLRGRPTETKEGRVMRALADVGFQADSKIRKAIEDYSMRVATRYFKLKKFAVKNTSKYQPYDLLCTTKEKRLFVEVKGTQEPGQGVILAANEVKHLKRHRHEYVLFILHSIRIDGKKPRGGRQRQVPGSKIPVANLQPINYKLTL